MVVRMRIYETNKRIESSDRVFYELVKPIHERYGAQFLGRYLDQKGRYVVLWQYENENELARIQQAVATDPESIANKQIRLNSGLHGIPFQEFILQSTDPVIEE